MKTITATEKLAPCYDRVVIKPNEAEEKTPGGIVLPQAAQEKTNRGKVLAVGPGRMFETGVREEPEVTPGDEVLYDKWGGAEIELGGDKVRVMRLCDILGVVEKA
jgi:chaperonin GroES